MWAPARNRRAAPPLSYSASFLPRLAVFLVYLPATHLPTVASQTSLPISQPILLFLAAAGWTNNPTASAARPIATTIERITSSVIPLFAGAPQREVLLGGNCGNCHP